eukprot:10624303-Heterocapsa_arctica.AAC.1
MEGTATTRGDRPGKMAEPAGPAMDQRPKIRRMAGGHRRGRRGSSRGATGRSTPRSRPAGRWR